MPRWEVDTAKNWRKKKFLSIRKGAFLAQLVEKPPMSRAVWAVAARRTIPRVGYQSWSGDPADNDSPAQFGVLIFE